MKGAEIALVEGVAVSFGSGDDCDVIVQDATVPAKACEFEVDASGVRIAVGGGSAETLPPFEVRSFGTTSFAVGPVDGEWQELIKPVRPAIERADPEDKDGKPPSDSTTAPQASDADGEAATSSKSPYLLLAVILLFVAAVVVLLAWLFWPRIVEKYPEAESARVAVVEKVGSWTCPCRTQSSSILPAAPSPSLADLAKQHGLTLERSNPANPSNLLRGNLTRRTERLAVRALALAADPNVKFDLTDDETLLSAASELLFACSDGALKVESASNRAVTISGFAPSRGALERAIRALNADVKGIEKLDASRVKVGGTAPAAVVGTPFVREQPPGEHPVVAIPAHTPNPPLPKAKKQRDYPIAGILTVPYPCVVMRNGVRLVEGAQIGGVVLVKIEADKLTLRDGNQDIEWRP